MGTIMMFVLMVAAAMAVFVKTTNPPRTIPVNPDGDASQ
jgi:hypothetical protein